VKTLNSVLYKNSINNMNDLIKLRIKNQQYIISFLEGLFDAVNFSLFKLFGYKNSQMIDFSQ
jgi:hypothetical protein